MNKQEKIVCAAVQFVYEYRNEVVMCLDYDDGRVQEHKCRDLDFGVIAPFKNGFITSKNRFVDAKEAMGIAIKANQYSDYQSMIGRENHSISIIDDAKENNRKAIGFSSPCFVPDLDSCLRNIEHFKSKLREELKPSDLY